MNHLQYTNFLCEQKPCHIFAITIERMHSTFPSLIYYNIKIFCLCPHWCYYSITTAPVHSKDIVSDKIIIALAPGVPHADLHGVGGALGKSSNEVECIGQVPGLTPVRPQVKNTAALKILRPFLPHVLSFISPQTHSIYWHPIRWDHHGPSQTSPSSPAS